MTLSKYVVLSLTGLVLSAPLAVSAQAQKMHKPMHHVAPHHAAPHHTMRHGTSAARTTRGATDADHSADSLNAQSLTRSQTPQ